MESKREFTMSMYANREDLLADAASYYEKRSLILEKQRDELLVAGKALIERWDTPNWKDAVHTGEFIAKLRDVIAKIEDK